MNNDAKSRLKEIANALARFRVLQDQFGDDRDQYLATHPDEAEQIKSLLQEAEPLVMELEDEIQKSTDPRRRAQLGYAIVRFEQLGVKTPLQLIAAAINVGSAMYVKGAVDMLMLIASLLV